MPDKKLRIGIKYGDIEVSYKIAESIAPDIYNKIKNIIDPVTSTESPDVEI